MYQKTPSVKNKIIYKNYKNTLNKLLKRAEKQHYYDLLIKHKDNIRKSWSVIKSIIQKNKRSTCQSKFKLPDGPITDDKQLISTTFNDFFVNIGPTLASKIPNVDKSPLLFMCNRVAETIFLSPVTTTEIDKLILSLKNSAPGWDDITASLLKVSLDYIRDPLCYLCNKSLQSGIFPAQLKLQMFCHCIKQKIHFSSTIIDLCPCCVYCQRFLRKLCTVVWMNSLLNWVSCMNFSSGSERNIPHI